MVWYDEEGVWCADSLVLNNLPKLLLWKDLEYLFPSRFAIFIDKRFSKLQEIKADTLKLVEKVKETHSDLPKPAQMMRVQKALETKYKDKKLVQVGFRLAMGMNIEDYML